MRIGAVCGRLKPPENKVIVSIEGKVVVPGMSGTCLSRKGCSGCESGEVIVAKVPHRPDRPIKVAPKDNERGRHR